MPKMLITEEEKADILRQREIRAMQAVAWNEAVEQAVEIVVNNYIACQGDAKWLADNVVDKLNALRRNPAKP